MAIQHYRSVISMVCGGNFAQVVQNWEIDSATTNPFVVAKGFVDAFSAPAAGFNYSEKLQAILAEDDCFISSVRAQKIGDGGGSVAIKTFPPTTLPGLFSGHTEDAGVAGVMVIVPDNLDGKSGRNFFPGVSEDALTNGRFTADYKTAFFDMGDNMIEDGVTGIHGTFVLCLKYGSPASWAPIKHGYLSPSPGTIRKRLVPF